MPAWHKLVPLAFMGVSVVYYEDTDRHCGHSDERPGQPHPSGGKSRSKETLDRETAAFLWKKHQKEGELQGDQSRKRPSISVP